MRTIELSDTTKVTVYPVGVRHLLPFGTFISRATKTIQQERGRMKGLQDLGILAEMGTGILSRDLLPLIAECVKSDDPDWKLTEDTDLVDFAELVEAWIELNFTNPKKREALLRMASKVLSSVLNREVKPGTIWEDLLSLFASEPATADQTSMTTGSQDTHTAAGA